MTEKDNETQKKLLEELKELTKQSILCDMFCWLIPKSKLAAIKLRKIAKKHDLLWGEKELIIKYGSRYDLDVKINQFDLDKLWKPEEEKKINKNETLKTYVEYLAKHYNVHFQVRIKIFDKDNSMIWSDKCPSRQELSKESISTTTISFSIKKSTTQRAAEETKKKKKKKN